MKKKDLQYGFTLIELLVYVALVSLILAGSLIIVFNLLQGSERLAVAAAREEEANFLLKKIEWAISGAESISLPASGGSGNSLSLNMTASELSPAVFSLSGGYLMLSLDNAPAVTLNSLSIGVQNLNFEHLAAASGKPAGSRTTLTVGGSQYTTLLYLRK